MVAEMTRIPQMLQPDRFTRRTRLPATRFLKSGQTSPPTQSALYGQMNALYVATKQPRWGRDGFNLILPGDEAAWKPIADQWDTMLKDQPENDRARLGLAFSYTMMGADADALPVCNNFTRCIRRAVVRRCAGLDDAAG
jgi:hypothetical protein